MRKIALAAVTALALPLAIPAMAQNSANPNAQSQQQNAPEQMQPNGQGANQQPQLSQNQIRQVQQALDQKGFKSGRADGKLGPETQAALRDFQKSKGLQQTGQPDQQTLAQLGINEQSTTGQAPANEPMQNNQNQPSNNQPSNNQQGSQPAPNGK